MHKALLITNKGAESIVEKEVKGLVKCKNIKKNDSCVICEVKDLLEICRLAYRAQSVSRVILLLAEFKVETKLEKTLANFKKSIEKLDLKEWSKKTAKVKSKRLGEHEFNSVDIGTEAGKILFNKIKEKNKIIVKVNYKNPEMIFYIYVYDNKGYFGIDFSGFDLSKRQYKIFNHPESLNSISGYVAAKEADIDEKKVIIDPFMGSGVIVIEAALDVLKFPIRYYDKEKLFFTKLDFFKKQRKKFFEDEDKKTSDKKTNIYGYDAQLRYLKATQKNSKLAGVNKKINLSKVSVEWLDTKFEKNSVDVIVTDPPRYGINRNISKLKKTYNELFYQAEYILKKSGLIVIITRDFKLLEESAKNHKFKISEKYILNQGKDIFNIIKFQREK